MSLHTHSHTHTHSHACEHPPNPRDARARFRKLRQVIALTAVYLVAEVLGGIFSGSLALLADAGHMLADLGSATLALFAAWLATHPPSPQKTFGYYRMEILAAFVNGLFLAAVSVWIFYEALHRFATPHAIHGDWMLGVALGGLMVNLVAAWLLHDFQGENLNMRGAYLHVLGDLLGSVGAIVAAILVLMFGWNWADPVISILIALLVLVSAGRLVWDSVNILLEASPAHINVDAVRQAMLTVEGVLSVHDLHVWSITSGQDAIAAHVVVCEGLSHLDILDKLQTILTQQFKLGHSTLQLEDTPCDGEEFHC